MGLKKNKTIETAASAKSLEVKISGITFKNPVILASGTCGYGEEISQFIDLNSLGGITTKGISLEPKSGNSPVRICETASGMLNSIGLENVGVKRFIAEKIPFLRRFKTNIIVNIFGNTIEEYAQTAKQLSDAGGIDAIEINASCPNVKKGGMEFGKSSEGITRLVEKVKEVSCVPVFIKLSPNVSDIAELARAAESAGADGVSLINTLVGMAIDIKRKKAVLSTATGGLSGPAIKPVALAMVWKVKNAVKIPIIGMGGIMNSRDALEFIIAGATAIETGTANMVNPYAVIEIIKGMTQFLKDEKLSSINMLAGTLKT
ncbi:MAG: dihydroorotate dehydrogenase [Candidatus Schekmanbacteria bacterium]|nr:dihydroorotate dehydrogenase [Candidatus Schekmanbacteria bacterium]